VTILSADNSDFIILNQLILQQIEENSSLNIDYEDCMQIYLCNKYKCEYILTSDKRFCKGIKENFTVEVIDLDGCLARLYPSSAMPMN
jgi:predicted nucleic acid-binding protein